MSKILNLCDAFTQKKFKEFITSRVKMRLLIIIKTHDEASFPKDTACSNLFVIK